MATTAPRQNCPLCLSDEDYEVTVSGDASTWLYTCNSPEHGITPYVWTSVIPKASSPSREGLLAQHGVYEDLLACIPPGENLWLEHGVVERRYLERCPDVYFGVLLPTYKHAKNGAKPGQSTSLRLAMAMSQLRREGLLVYRTWKPTGWWAKNSTISWWATPPDPPDEHRLSWASYAASNGLDSQDWDLTPP